MKVIVNQAAVMAVTGDPNGMALLTKEAERAFAFHEGPTQPPGRMSATVAGVEYDIVERRPPGGILIGHVTMLEPCKTCGAKDPDTGGLFDDAGRLSLQCARCGEWRR